MIRGLLLVLLALALGGCGTGGPDPTPAAPRAGWREHRPEGGRYRVQMPAAPADITEQRGPSLVHAAVLGPLPGTMQAFTVLYRDLTPQERQLPREEMLRRALAEGGPAEGVRKVKAGAASGLEGSYRGSAAVSVRSRVFLVGGRLFTVTAMFPDTAAARAEGERFLDSFEPL